MYYRYKDIKGKIINHLPDGLVEVDYGGTILTLPAIDNELLSEYVSAEQLTATSEPINNSPIEVGQKDLTNAHEQKVEAGSVGVVDVELQYNDKGEHLAPNGKPSKLSEQHAKLVRTPKFKEWFGDWENDPKNASKVVDENGEPLVVYHGTESDFTEFDKKFISSRTQTDIAKLGFWFTNKWEAEGFAMGFDESQRVEGVGKVIPSFLNIRTPLNIKDTKIKYNTDDIAGMVIEGNQSEIKRIFDSGDYDGITLDNIWISDEPNQIKAVEQSLKETPKAGSVGVGGDVDYENIENDVPDNQIEGLTKRIGTKVINYGGIEIPIKVEREEYDKNNLNIWVGEYSSQMGRELVRYNKKYDKVEDVLNEIRSKIVSRHEAFNNAIEHRSEFNKKVEQGAKSFDNSDMKRLIKSVLSGYFGKEINAMSGSDYLTVNGKKLRFSDHTRPATSKWNFIHTQGEDVPNGLMFKEDIHGYIDYLLDGKITNEQKQKIDAFFDEKKSPDLKEIKYPKAVEQSLKEPPKAGSGGVVDVINAKERTEWNGHKVGDVIGDSEMSKNSGGNYSGKKGEKYVLVQEKLSNLDGNRQDLYDQNDGYKKEEDVRLENLKKDFNKTPPIPDVEDGLHRIVAAKELGHETILMWKPLKAAEQPLKETTKAGSVGVGGDATKYIQKLTEHYGDKARATEEYNGYIENLKDVDKNGGTAYRIVFLDKKGLDKSNLGEHWTLDKNAITDFYNSIDIENESLKPHIITAKTSPNSIDFKNSLDNFSQLPNEYEVNFSKNPSFESLNEYDVKNERLGKIGNPELVKAVEQSLKETPKAGRGGVVDVDFTAKGGNKVVDVDGKPITVYHGTNENFESFDAGKLGDKNVFAQSAKEGFFFAESKETADNYTKTNAVDLSILSDKDKALLKAVQDKYKGKIEEANNKINEVKNKYRNERVKELSDKLGGSVSDKLNSDVFKKLSDSKKDELLYNFSTLLDNPIDYLNKAKLENESNGNNKNLKEVTSKAGKEFESKYFESKGQTQRIISANIIMKNPLVVDFNDVEGRDFTDHIKKAKENGNDGVIFKNVEDGAEKDNIYVAFDKDQIKITNKNISEQSLKETTKAGSGGVGGDGGIAVYHGSPFNRFSAKDYVPNRHGLIFFTENKNFAEKYMQKRDDLQMPKGAGAAGEAGVSKQVIYPKNTLDYKNIPQEVIDILESDGNIDHLTPERKGYGTNGYNDYSEAIKEAAENGDWFLFENKKVIDKLKELGYDSIKLRNENSYNDAGQRQYEDVIAVFDKNLIKDEQPKAETPKAGSGVGEDKVIVYRGGENKDSGWVSDDKEHAENYGKAEQLYIPKKLNILDTDLDYTTFEKLVDEYDKGGDYEEYKFEPPKEFINFLKSKGYEGLQHETSSGNNKLIFDKSQIKAVEQSLKETPQAGSVGVGGEVVKDKSDLSGTELYHGTTRESFKQGDGDYIFWVGDKESAIKHAKDRADSQGGTPIIVSTTGEKLKDKDWVEDDDNGSQPYKTWQESWNGWGSFVSKGEHNISDFKVQSVEQSLKETPKAEVGGMLAPKGDTNKNRPIKVRFNLGKGENFMKWKVENVKTDQVKYYEPDKVKFLMSNCKLTNQPTTALKIFNGEIDKAPIAWVNCESIKITNKLSEEKAEDRVFYNPRVSPNWIDEKGKILDNYVFEQLTSDGRAIYYEDENGNKYLLGGGVPDVEYADGGAVGGMKQIETCIGRALRGEKPLAHKYRALIDDGILYLYHYHHLLLIYNLAEKSEVFIWHETPTDKRGLNAALKYLNEQEQSSTQIKSGYVEHGEYRTLLSLFDYSGAWSQPFQDAGWNVIRWDIKLSEFMDINKIDLAETALELFENVDGLIAAPPCTDFAVSGAQYWKFKDEDGRTRSSVELVDQVMRLVNLFAPTDLDYDGTWFWAIENPVGRMDKLVGMPTKPWYFNPYEFAGWVDHKPADIERLAELRAKSGIGLTRDDAIFVQEQNTYTKKTGLWGDFVVPEKKPIEPVYAKQGDTRTSPMAALTGGKSELTKTLRSMTPLGFAKAFYEANKNYQAHKQPGYKP